VLLVRTVADMIFQVCAIRPYTGRFLVIKTKATIVETIRFQLTHTREILHGRVVGVFDVPFSRFEVFDNL
jgi:hypothetical protein